LFWFVWFVSFIWLNQTNRINQRNQMNKTDQMNQINPRPARCFSLGILDGLQPIRLRRPPVRAITGGFGLLSLAMKPLKKSWPLLTRLQHCHSHP
jgi:hypothetical protein